MPTRRNPLCRLLKGLWTAAMLLALAATCACAGPSPAAPPSPTATATALPGQPVAVPATPTTWPSTWTPEPTGTPTATPTNVVQPATPTSAALVSAPTPTRASPTSAAPGRIAAWEDTITLNSYGWKDALVATAPGDIVYPYPRLNRDLVTLPQPRTYKTVVLENEYTKLTLLPELGGRILRWLDKTSGQEMFYANPVIKPTHWGAREWWLATGGMEWAFPVEEHGLVEWRAWRYQIVREQTKVSVVLSDVDDRTGLAVEVTVTLETTRSFLSIRPRIHNPTDVEQSFQFWLNGMFALSPANRPSPELRFILPCDTVIVHSTGDKELPEPGQEMSWPIHNGRDISRYGNWNGWLGAFSPPIAYMGAYDPTSDMGVVRVWPPGGSQGAKIFGHGGLDPGIWTDDGSGYVELWGGLLPTFWDNTSLAPGASVGWTEHWYSVNGMGGLGYANDDAALWLAAGGESVQIGAISTLPVQGRLVLERDDQAAATWDVTLVPGAPFRASYSTTGGQVWGLRLVGDDGRTIAAHRLTGPQG